MRMKKRFERSLSKMLQRSIKERNFRNSPAFEIADYFRIILKSNGYTITQSNWDKTKRAAGEIIFEHSHIPISIWKECVDFAFSDVKKADSFWGKVPVMNLGTVIKLYTFYKMCRESISKADGRRGIRYGKLRSK